MITLREYMDAIEYRITEGSSYTWDSFGNSAYRLESTQENDRTSCTVQIVFDTTNQTVYEVEAHDYKNNRCYRYTNSQFAESVRVEAVSRGVDYNVAYDDVKFIDLETPDDWLEKARAIVRGEEYDTRIKIPLELEDSELLTIMTAAHEQDITLNDYVERILRNYILEYEVPRSTV